MSSVRMPGKVLAPLAGEPALQKMMGRVARMKAADVRIVATSADPGDDTVADLCSAHGLECVRGPLDDVLARFVAAVPAGAEVVVRLTGDCPLIDAAVADRHVETYLREGSEQAYVTNAVVRTMPDGLDVEVFSRALLERAHAEATDPVRSRALHSLDTKKRETGRGDPADRSLRAALDLDTPVDHRIIAQIYEELDASGAYFDSRDIYRLLLRRPELIHVEGDGELSSDRRVRLRDRIADHLSIDEATS